MRRKYEEAVRARKLDREKLDDLLVQLSNLEVVLRSSHTNDVFRLRSTCWSVVLLCLKRRSVACVRRTCVFNLSYNVSEQSWTKRRCPESTTKIKSKPCWKKSIIWNVLMIKKSRLIMELSADTRLNFRTCKQWLPATPPMKTESSSETNWLLPFVISEMNTIRLVQRVFIDEGYFSWTTPIVMTLSPGTSLRFKRL